MARSNGAGLDSKGPLEPRVGSSLRLGSAESRFVSMRVGAKLRILHVGKFYPPRMGGIETHLHALCGELRKVSDVSILVASEDSSDKDEVVEDVPVLRAGTILNLASAPFCPTMTSRIRASEADLVHLHLPNPPAILAYLASGHPGPLILTYHSDTIRHKLLGALIQPLLHAALRRSSAIIVTSPNYLRTSPVLTRYRARGKVIPHGIHVAVLNALTVRLSSTSGNNMGTGSSSAWVVW